MNRCALTIRMLMILRARGTKYPVSTRVLAQELETNPRNIREFKKELVTAGFNIVEKKGPYGGYMLDEEQLMPVTRLTEEEMAALEEGISFMKGHPEVSFYPAYRSAMDKVLDVIKYGKTAEDVFLGSSMKINFYLCSMELRGFFLLLCNLLPWLAIIALQVFLFVLIARFVIWFFCYRNK